MRNLLYILLIAPILAITQVPQGVGYQGVATDAAGFELINQSIWTWYQSCVDAKF